MAETAFPIDQEKKPIERAVFESAALSTEGRSTPLNGTHAQTFDSQFVAANKSSEVTESSKKFQWSGEMVLGVFGIAVTLIALTAAIHDISVATLNQFMAKQTWNVIGNLIFSVFICFFVYGSLVYQVTRLAHLQRRGRYLSASARDNETHLSYGTPNLTILVPSYKEEIELVRMVLLSAALQNCGHRRIVLLIDDPPYPNRREDLSALEAMRRLPQELQSEFSRQHEHYSSAYHSFQRRSKASAGEETSVLVGLLDAAAEWLETQGRLARGEEHVRRVLIEKVIHARAVPLREAAAKVRESESAPSIAELGQHYDDLLRLFDVEFTSFERKRYENLSHEPNKAMNLNSYIGLLGKSFGEERKDEKLILSSALDDCVDLQVPAADYLITLDADSLIMPDYAAILMSLCEAPGNERIAVAQTPYSAFPGARRKLERIAGATTDIQYLIHQGFTAFHGTYWVGANALLRTKALAEIEEKFWERGYPMSRFIHDRTVIEDTESSVDLISKGWQLFNYPERLSYSATPPDFGSLKIQRWRWANGGLVILPKLLRYLAYGPKTWRKLAEAFMRIHYLTSIAVVNIGLVIMLAIPLVEQAPLVWLPLAAVPYFLAYARDLSVIGYKASDVFRVYALNLLLIPVNLAGVGRSLQQALTGKQTPFVRTPKVTGRTRTAPAYILAVCGGVLLLIFGGAFDLYKGHFLHAVFAWGNGAFLLYAILKFVGWRECRDDLLQAFA